MNRDESDMDQVDYLVLAWAKERPDLDVSPMHIFSRVARLAQQSDRRTDAALRPLNLKRSEVSVLYALLAAGQPYECTAGDLARLCAVTTGSLTKRVDRLCERGYVTRSQTGADGRVVTVRLTPAGVRAADRATRASLATTEAPLSHLSKAERRELATLLRRVSIDAERR